LGCAGEVRGRHGVPPLIPRRARGDAGELAAIDPGGRSEEAEAHRDASAETERNRPRHVRAIEKPTPVEMLNRTTSVQVEVDGAIRGRQILGLKADAASGRVTRHGAAPELPTELPGEAGCGEAFGCAAAAWPAR